MPARARLTPLPYVATNEPDPRAGEREKNNTHTQGGVGNISGGKKSRQWRRECITKHGEGHTRARARAEGQSIVKGMGAARRDAKHHLYSLTPLSPSPPQGIALVDTSDGEAAVAAAVYRRTEPPKEKMAVRRPDLRVRCLARRLPHGRARARRAGVARNAAYRFGKTRDSRPHLAWTVSSSSSSTQHRGALSPGKKKSPGVLRVYGIPVDTCLSSRRPHPTHPPSTVLAS